MPYYQIKKFRKLPLPFSITKGSFHRARQKLPHSQVFHWSFLQFGMYTTFFRNYKHRAQNKDLKVGSQVPAQNQIWPVTLVI